MELHILQHSMISRDQDPSELSVEISTDSSAKSCGQGVCQLLSRRQIIASISEECFELGWEEKHGFRVGSEYLAAT